MDVCANKRDRCGGCAVDCAPITASLNEPYCCDAHPRVYAPRKGPQGDETWLSNDDQRDAAYGSGPLTMADLREAKNQVSCLHFCMLLPLSRNVRSFFKLIK